MNREQQKMTDKHDDDCDCPVCSGEFDATEFYRGIAENIEEHGQHVMGVFGGPGDILPFCYSIGLTGRGLPELLLIGGFAPEDAAAVLNWLGEAMRERGRPFHDGEIVDWGGRLPVKVINAGDEARDEYAIQAMSYYSTDSIVVQQVLVPDTMGRFSGDPHCEFPYSEVPVLVETQATMH
jgi:Domain of unknown function (DUF4262)